MASVPSVIVVEPEEEALEAAGAAACQRPAEVASWAAEAVVVKAAVVVELCPAARETAMDRRALAAEVRFLVWAVVTPPVSRRLHQAMSVSPVEDHQPGPEPQAPAAP